MLILESSQRPWIDNDISKGARNNTRSCVISESLRSNTSNKIKLVICKRY